MRKNFGFTTTKFAKQHRDNQTDRQTDRHLVLSSDSCSILCRTINFTVPSTSPFLSSDLFQRLQSCEIGSEWKLISPVTAPAHCTSGACVVGPVSSRFYIRVATIGHCWSRTGLGPRPSTGLGHGGSKISQK